MSENDKMTLQEAAIAAGFEDFMLEAGGGIRVWDSACVVGIVVSEKVVREYARINTEKRVEWPKN
jgi:hypothetical protein